MKLIIILLLPTQKTLHLQIKTKVYFFFILLIIRISFCNTTVGLIDLSVEEVAEFMRRLRTM